MMHFTLQRFKGNLTPKKKATNQPVFRSYLPVNVASWSLSPFHGAEKLGISSTNARCSLVIFDVQRVYHVLPLYPHSCSVNNVPCSKHPRDVKFFGQYWNGIRLFCPKFLRPKAGANEWEDPECQLLVFGSTSSCATLWWREHAWIPKPGIGGSLQCFRFLLCLEARSTSQIGCFAI
jgi:hypothetical protein